jgi:hypothetical protein
MKSGRNTEFELCLSMQSERRHAFRVNVTLPFAWCRVTTEECTEDIETNFVSEHSVVLAQSLRKIDVELNTFFATIKSPYTANSTASMLQLLNTKLDLLANHLVYPTPSATFELSLSTEGLSCNLPSDEVQSLAQEQKGQASQLAWHLQLRTGHHIMGLGRVVEASADETETETMCCRIEFTRLRS